MSVSLTTGWRYAHTVAVRPVLIPPTCTVAFILPELTGWSLSRCFGFLCVTLVVLLGMAPSPQRGNLPEVNPIAACAGGARGTPPAPPVRQGDYYRIPKQCLSAVIAHEPEAPLPAERGRVLNRNRERRLGSELAPVLLQEVRAPDAAERADWFAPGRAQRLGGYLDDEEAPLASRGSRKPGRDMAEVIDRGKVGRVNVAPQNQGRFGYR